MTIVLCFILFAFILFLEYIPILKGKDNKLKWVYGVFLATSLTVIILHELDFSIPSPSEPIANLFTSILKLK